MHHPRATRRTAAADEGAKDWSGKDESHTDAGDGHMREVSTGGAVDEIEKTPFEEAS